MDTINFLFSPAAAALGHTLLFSIGQAFVIFICLQIVLKFIPNVSSHVKYSLAYCAYLAIGAWFFITFLRQYSIAQNGVFLQKAMEENPFKLIDFDKVSAGSSFFSLSFLNEYLPLLVAFYLLGIFWYSSWLTINLFKTNQLKSQGLFELDPDWKQYIINLASRMNIKRSLKTYFSTKVNTPMMIGFFKPVILLPFAAMNHLSAEQFEVIILHELAHIRRNDYLLNLIQSLLDTLLFFNPFTWWITKYIREEREKSCDEMVLQYSDPLHYARTLLSLEEPLAKQPLIMTAVGKRSHLFHRIKNIMEMKNNHLNLRQKFITLLVIAIATVSVAWLSPAENSSGRLERNSNNKGNSVKHTKNSFSTFLNFRVKEDTLLPGVPPPPAPPVLPATPIAPMPPAATAHNGLPALPPAAPLPPFPPTPPFPPAPLPEGIMDSLPFPADFFNSKEWKKQEQAIKESTEEMRKYFESDAWKKQQDMMKENATAMKKYFNSPEWKQQQKLFQKNAEEMKKIFSSPEWKKQQELIKKNGEEMKKYFDSPEWKQQQKLIKKNAEKVKEYFNSPEWKSNRD